MELPIQKKSKPEENIVEIIKTPVRITPDSPHQHEWERDYSEKDFIAYRCKDARCGKVILFDKD